MWYVFPCSPHWGDENSILTCTGIFAYCSFLVEKDRKYVCEVLCNGLARLEYRGYDSAGECSIPPLKVSFLDPVG